MEESAAPQPYRLGYREGFRDGYGEAQRPADERSGSSDRDHAHRAGGVPDHASPDDVDGKGGEGEDARSASAKDEDGKAKDGKARDGESKDGAGKDGSDGEGKDDAKSKTPLYKRPLLVGGVLLVLLVAIIVAVVFWRHSRHHAKTDDAFIDGHASQVAAQAAGRIIRIYVGDNQRVNAGDPLVDIDSRDVDARIAEVRGQLATAAGQYEQAEAQVAVQRANALQADAGTRQAQADLAKASQDLARYRNVNPDAVAKQQVDAAVSAERQARAKRDATALAARAAHTQIDAALAQVRAGRAQVEAAKAQLESAQLQGSYTHVVAPVAGRVTRRTVEAGNVINVGQPLMALVSDELWVTANYKETQLTGMKPGQSVEIVVDAYPDVTFRGHVDSIQRATGAYFSMLPAENATGNYVKVVQRVPVKIVFDDDRVRQYVIGPGMSVTPDVTLP